MSCDVLYRGTLKARVFLGYRLSEPQIPERHEPGISINRCFIAVN